MLSLNGYSYKTKADIPGQLALWARRPGNGLQADGRIVSQPAGPAEARCAEKGSGDGGRGDQARQ
ncbi:MAG TPA: hypothetical protein VK195_08220, partial [Burkholderiaceae bacterium]|nr:hypothetical protein [Burkholderiaceae bacterium]